MAHGAVRGAIGAWLGLAALDAVLSSHGSQAATGLLGWASSAVNRALSPDVALIPDYRNGSPSSSSSSNLGATLGSAVAGAVATGASNALPKLPSNAVIQSRPDQLPILGQPVPS